MTIQGSKRKYAKYIVPILQKCINENKLSTFVDVCCGGCNIIKNIKCNNRIAIDKNPYLIALWKKLQEPHFEFPPFPSREDWDRCKNGFEERDWYTGYVQISASYLARGFSGGYNKDEKKYWGWVHTTQKDLPLIKDIKFVESDYSGMLHFSGNCIYIDPPYADTKKYQIDPNFNYERFWQCVREASKDSYVFVSEQSAPEDFVPVWSLETERLLNGITTPCTENLYVFKDGLAAKFML